MRPRKRIAVLVPAHDEAALIARCVQSLQAQTYPSRLYDVIVVADNCSDATASIARSAGADVLVRDEPDARGKGRALRWAFDRVLRRPIPPDAVVVVDADSVADPCFLSALVRPFESGASAVQGESLLAEDGSRAASLRAAAFLLVNRVRPAGRSALGLPCDLTGNGMLLSSELLRAYPWDAFTSAEDLEYTRQPPPGRCAPGLRGRGDPPQPERAERPGGDAPAASVGGRQAPRREEAAAAARPRKPEAPRRTALRGRVRPCGAPTRFALSRCDCRHDCRSRRS